MVVAAVVVVVHPLRPGLTVNPRFTKMNLSELEPQLLKDRGMSADRKRGH